MKSSTHGFNNKDSGRQRNKERNKSNSGEDRLRQNPRR